jgi:hypothetical protein
MLMATTTSSSINEKPRLHFLAALPGVIECPRKKTCLADTI